MRFVLIPLMLAAGLAGCDGDNAVRITTTTTSSSDTSRCRIGSAVVRPARTRCRIAASARRPTLKIAEAIMPSNSENPPSRKSIG